MVKKISRKDNFKSMCKLISSHYSTTYSNLIHIYIPWNNGGNSIPKTTITVKIVDFINVFQNFNCT